MATLDPLLRNQLSAYVITAVQQAFGPYFRGAILKGSAYKGDFIPYYSDFDVHTFIDRAAMLGPTLPAIDYALAFQQVFGSIDPHDFQLNSCQIYFITWDDYPADWVRPLPGTYCLIAGDLPPGFQNVTADEYIRKAHDDIHVYTQYFEHNINRMVDKPNNGLPAIARLTGTCLKPLPYIIATIAGNDPFQIWRMPLREVLAIAEPIACPECPISDFFAQIEPWPPEPERARYLIRLGYLIAQEIKAWYKHSPYAIAPV